MSLPPTLRQAIVDELAHNREEKLAVAAMELIERYREGPTNERFMSSDIHRAAYLATRLPATYAAVVNTLQQVRNRLPTLAIKSLLDLGAGPGTGLWAASTLFPEIETATAFEGDPALVEMGKRLARHCPTAAVQKATWKNADLAQLGELPQHDMILLSYSIGELTPEAQLKIAEAAWKAATKLLVIVEPGTPVGFARIRALRAALISFGAQMVAPCPHTDACPMPPGDWCHFSARLDRSALHRRLKGGTLTYEDEKFSYVVVAKEPCPLPYARILRYPQNRTGHTHVSLCTATGLKDETFSKKQGALYRQVRRLDWGDAIEATQA